MDKKFGVLVEINGIKYGIFYNDKTIRANIYDEILLSAVNKFKYHLSWESNGVMKQDDFFISALRPTAKLRIGSNGRKTISCIFSSWLEKNYVPDKIIKIDFVVLTSV